MTTTVQSKLAWQVQTGAPALSDWLARFPPHHLKVIARSWFDPGAIRRWRAARPGGLLVIRDYFPDENLDEGKFGDDLGLAEQVRDCRPIVECPINEAWQTGDGLSKLDDYTLDFLNLCAARGFTPAIGVFSEGNPPGTPTDPFADWPRFHPALRFCRQLGGYLALHEYGIPSLGLDDWHLLRHRRVWAVLPEDCRVPILVTESGIDGGIEGRTEVGWRGYMDARHYADWLRGYRAELDKDDYVHASFVFLCGGFPQWSRFDVAGEGDLEDVFQVATNPTIWVPGPVPQVVAPAPIESNNTTAAAAVSSVRQTNLDIPMTPPPITRLATSMRAGLYYRMDADVPENTVDELVALCASGGFTAICPKGADGDEWEGDFDHGELAINSVDALLGQKARYATAGVHLVPWVVYRGIYSEAEAHLHAAIARACGEVIVDFEWGYKGFADHGTFADAVAYFAELRAEAPGAVIHFNPDPRQYNTPTGYRADPILPHVDTVLPQNYWTDFGTGWRDQVGTPIAAAGRPVYQVLPGDAHTADLVSAVAYLHDRGDAQVYVFQRTGLVPGDFARLKEVLAVADQVTPTPTPPVVDAIDAIIAATRGFDDTALRDLTWRLAEEWSRRGWPHTESGLKAITSLGKGER